MEKRGHFLRKGAKGETWFQGEKRALLVEALLDEALLVSKEKSFWQNGDTF